MGFLTGDRESYAGIDGRDFVIPLGMKAAIVFLLGLFLLFGRSGLAAEIPAKERMVILISLDGFPAFALEVDFSQLAYGVKFEYWDWRAKEWKEDWDSTFARPCSEPSISSRTAMPRSYTSSASDNVLSPLVPRARCRPRPATA